jgi:hypothetical protein
MVSLGFALDALGVGVFKIVRSLALAHRLNLEEQLIDTLPTGWLSLICWTILRISRSSLGVVAEGFGFGGACLVSSKT